MSEKTNCILLVQKDLKDIVSLSQKCIEAGFDENKIYATVSCDDISRFLNTKSISTIIIDSDLYNLKTATNIVNHALSDNLKTILVKSESSQKTIRMIMDKNLKYISMNINAKDLMAILFADSDISAKKVVHF